MVVKACIFMITITKEKTTVKQYAFSNKIQKQINYENIKHIK